VELRACANVGEVSIRADVNGQPGPVALGTMGYYLLESSEDSWRLRMTGEPTGGTFRLSQTLGGVTRTTGPIPFDTRHHAGSTNGLDNTVIDQLSWVGIPATTLTTGRLPNDIMFFHADGELAMCSWIPSTVTAARSLGELLALGSADAVATGPANAASAVSAATNLLCICPPDRSAGAAGPENPLPEPAIRATYPVPRPEPRHRHT
jgi:hypothetical protein